MNKTEELRRDSYKLLAGYGLGDEQITELTQRWLLLCKEWGLVWHNVEVDYDHDDESYEVHEEEAIDV